MRRSAEAAVQRAGGHREAARAAKDSGAVGGAGGICRETHGLYDVHMMFPGRLPLSCCVAAIFIYKLKGIAYRGERCRVPHAHPIWPPPGPGPEAGSKNSYKGYKGIYIQRLQKTLA